jgi:hypothetical protein
VNLKKGDLSKMVERFELKDIEVPKSKMDQGEN